VLPHQNSDFLANHPHAFTVALLVCYTTSSPVRYLLIPPVRCIASSVQFIMRYPMCFVLTFIVGFSRAISVFPDIFLLRSLCVPFAFPLRSSCVPSYSQLTNKPWADVQPWLNWVDTQQSAQPRTCSTRVYFKFIQKRPEGSSRASLCVFSCLPCAFPVHFTCVPLRRISILPGVPSCVSMRSLLRSLVPSNPKPGDGPYLTLSK